MADKGPSDEKLSNMVKCFEELQYKVLTKEEYDILLGINPDKIVTSAGTASAVSSTPKTVCATGGTKPKTTFAFQVCHQFHLDCS